MVSLLTGIAIDHGFISSVEDSIYNYFTHYDSFSNWDPIKEKINISNFLTMRHGYDLVDGDGHFTPMNNSTDMIKYTLDAPIKHQPGTFWAYSSQCTNVMGDLLRIASGERNFEDYLYQYLFDPLNISKPEYIYHVRSGKPMLGAGIFMKPRDMAKIGQLILDEGLWKGTRIVSKSWLDFSTRPVVDFKDGDYYGYHWWRRDFGNHNFLLAAGNGGQVIYISKELDLIIVMTGGNYDNDLMFQNRSIIEDFILPSLTN